MLSESVSKKFYEDIYSRVDQTCRFFGKRGAALRDDVMKAFDAYVESHAYPVDAKDRETVMIFTLLLPEIDRAVTRSAAARKRAHERASRLQSASRSPRRKSEKVINGASHRMARPLPKSESAPETNEAVTDNQHEQTFDSRGILKNRRQRRRELQDQRRALKKASLVHRT